MPIQLKRTRKIFTVLVPDGARTERVRHYVRDEDGTEHPVDREIKIPNYKEQEVVKVTYAVASHPLPPQITEASVMAQLPQGTLGKETREEIDYVEVPEPK